MKNTNLNRFGDTAFRIKNQVNFYLNLIDNINKLSINNKSKSIDKEIIYKQLISEGILNYSDNKQIDSNNRSSMLFKQLLEFKLLEKNNGEVLTTKLYKEIINLLDPSASQINMNTTHLPTLIFTILMLLSDSTESNAFRIFIRYLYDKYEREKNLKVSKQEISLFSVIENIDDFKNFASKSKSYTLDALFSNFPTIEEINIFLLNSEKNNLNKNFNLLLNNKNVPKFFKPTKELDIILKLLKDYSETNFKENVIDKYEQNNDFNKIVRCINKKFKLNYKSNKDLIKEEKLNLLYLFYKYKKCDLIYKDYKDINFRWFSNINLIKKVDKEYIIDEECLKLCKYILDNYSKLDDIQQIVKVVINKFNQLKIIQTSLPYTKNEVCEALSFFTKKEINFVKLREFLKLEEIANSTIYEYLINISIAIIFNYSVEEFLEYTNTLLDKNLKPIIHAPGKRSDGILYDKSYNLYSTVEATILKNSELIKEEESINNHVINYFDSKNIDSNYNILFIHNNQPAENSIFRFMGEENRSYKDPTKKINILMINTETLLKILENNKKDFLKIALDKLPLKIEKVDHQNLLNLFKKYLSLIDDITK